MAWKVDRRNSKLDFRVKHLRVTTVRGRFEQFEGYIHIDEENPQQSLVEGSADIYSIKTGIGPRDSNIRAASFFNAERFPRMTFRSTHISPFEGNRFQVHGDLTIKEVTRQVVFDVIDKGEQAASGGKRRWTFEAATTLNRQDFGLRWNRLMEAGGLLVGDEIECTAEIQVIQE